jgi:hypothetical protein
MMYSRDVRVDLSKGRRPGLYYFHPPAEEAKWSPFYVLREGKLCSDGASRVRCSRPAWRVFRPQARLFPAMNEEVYKAQFQKVGSAVSHAAAAETSHRHAPSKIGLRYRDGEGLPHFEMRTGLSSFRRMER